MKGIRKLSGLIAVDALEAAIATIEDTWRISKDEEGMTEENRMVAMIGRLEEGIDSLVVLLRRASEPI